MKKYFIALAAAFAIASGAVYAVGETLSEAADFTYDLTRDTEGVKITGVKGIKDAPYKERDETEKERLRVKKVIIPAVIEEMPVMEIGGSAFSSFPSLEAVELPETLTAISSYAFAGCKALNEISLPDGVTEIGEEAFKECAALKLVKIGASLKTIGYNAFSGCTSIIDIKLPDSVKSISQGAFSWCTSLASVTLSASLTYIAGDVFRGCSALEAVELPDSVESIGGSAFAGCKALKSVKFPSALIVIRERAFEDCASLEAVELPDTVTQKYEWYEIEGEGLMTERRYRYEGIASATAAFSGCTSLKTVKLSSAMLDIDDGMFSGCTSLETVVLPDCVEMIGVSAFSSCTALKSVTLPAELVCIDGYAFNGCTSLAEVVAPESLTKDVINSRYLSHDKETSSDYYGRHLERGICNNAFTGCTALPLKAKVVLRKLGYEGSFDAENDH